MGEGFDFEKTTEDCHHVDEEGPFERQQQPVGLPSACRRQDPGVFAAGKAKVVTI